MSLSPTNIHTLSPSKKAHAPCATSRFLPTVRICHIRPNHSSSSLQPQDIHNFHNSQLQFFHHLFQILFHHFLLGHRTPSNVIDAPTSTHIFNRFTIANYSLQSFPTILAIVSNAGPTIVTATVAATATPTHFRTFIQYHLRWWRH